MNEHANEIIRALMPDAISSEPSSEIVMGMLLNQFIEERIQEIIEEAEELGFPKIASKWQATKKNHSAPPRPSDQARFEDDATDTVAVSVIINDVEEHPYEDYSEALTEVKAIVGSYLDRYRVQDMFYDELEAAFRDQGLCIEYEVIVT